VTGNDAVQHPSLCENTETPLSLRTFERTKIKRQPNWSSKTDIPFSNYNLSLPV